MVVVGLGFGRQGEVLVVGFGVVSLLEVAPQRGWDTLLSGKLSTEVHRFTPLPWTSEVVDRGLKDLPMDNLFMPQPRSLPQSLKKIVGTKAKTEWTSTAPSMCPCEREDMALAEHCLENNSWETGSLSWLCCLTNGKDICLRHTSWPAGEYVFSLGTVGGTSAVGWPALECPGNFMEKFYKPDMTKNVVAVIITNPEEWEGFCYEWKSPLGVAASNGRWDPQNYGVAKMGVVWPLLKLAAYHGFWDFKRATLNLFLNHYKIVHDKASPLHDVLMKMVDKWFPDATDEDRLRILRSRVKRRDDVSIFLASPEAQELIDKNDADAIKEKVAAERVAVQEQVTLRTVITKLAVSVLGGADAIAAAVGAGRGRGNRF